MKTAFLYNPKAGSKLPPSFVLSRLAAFFEGDELLAADSALPGFGIPLTLVGAAAEGLGYFDAILAGVRALAEAGAERFACVGGDGTATYLRTALYILGLDLPILGVAAGTANVGPIISVKLEDLEGRHISEARETCYDGVAVLDREGNLVSLAFNDLIVGDTFLATVEGKSCNVSVHALLDQGKLTPRTPREDLIRPDFHVELNGRTITPALKDVRQIVISSVAHESHYGRAVYGPIGKCDWSGKKGLIALCDHIAVTFKENDAGTERFSAMQYLLFGPGDSVVLRGFEPEAALVCDGNPYKLAGNAFAVRYEKDLVRTITI